MATALLRRKVVLEDLVELDRNPDERVAPLMERFESDDLAFRAQYHWIAGRHFDLEAHSRAQNEWSLDVGAHHVHSAQADVARFAEDFAIPHLVETKSNLAAIVIPREVSQVPLWHVFPTRPPAK